MPCILFKGFVNLSLCQYIPFIPDIHNSNIDIQHINGSNIQTDKMLQFNKPALAISLSSSKSKPTEIRFEHFQFVPSPSAIEQHLQHQYQQPHRDKEATPKQKRYYIYNKVINYSTISNETQSNRRRSRSAMDKRTTDDFVSKNISLLLENLLKSYENSQLPTHGEGKLKLSASMWSPTNLLPRGCRAPTLMYHSTDNQ